MNEHLSSRIREKLSNKGLHEGTGGNERKVGENDNNGE